jgi:hypothetical protein
MVWQGSLGAFALGLARESDIHSIAAAAKKELCRCRGNCELPNQPTRALNAMKGKNQNGKTKES